MTSSARINGDIRMIAAGLAANEAIVRPAVITATGRAAPSQFAVVPTNGSAAFALLPHVDYDDVPDLRPGGGFIGGRHSSFVPFLAPGAITAADDIRVNLRRLPDSRDAIRARLRGDAGLHWAPGALFSLAAWEDEWVYVWLDHLRRNGTDARLVMAHAQAVLAVRRMWLRVVWEVDAPPHTLIPELFPSILQQSGAVAAGRALLDVVRVLFRLIDETVTARIGAAPAAASAAPMRRIKALLETFVDLLTIADGRPEQHARKELGAAAETALRLLDAVALFSVAAEPLDQRWRRLDKELAVKQADPCKRLSPADLDAFEARLNNLTGALLGARLEMTVWPSRVRRSLFRLVSPDVAARLAGLDRIRGDLLYTLLITRRLDRPYLLFPWLAAPHAAFLHCAGGALGAFASLLDCGRRMEIARELKRQVGDMPADPDRHAPATVARLTIPAAQAMWRSRYLMTVAVDRGYAAGIALDQGAISHASITAGFNGAWFSPAHAISALRFGRLDWSLPLAMRDRRTATTVQHIEQTRPVMQLKTHDKDLPRHLGMTIKRLLAETVVSVFPDHDKRGTGKAHRRRAVAAAVKAGRSRGDAGQSLFEATLQLVRSMLLTVDVVPASDPQPRDAIAAQIASAPMPAAETARVDELQDRATRKSAAYDEHENGQGSRRNATKHEPTLTDPRGTLLRALADDVARWREPAKPRERPLNPRPDGRSKPARYAGPPRDDLLDDILRGRADLGLLTPVGALALPLLWLAPLIDRPQVAWMMRGAPAAAAPAGSDYQAAAISFHVARVHGWASLLYARSLPTRTSVTAACHLFTGHSTITADLSHV